MTDRPEDRMPDDEARLDQDDAVAEPVPEPGLVVEDDEIDLDEGEPGELEPDEVVPDEVVPDEMVPDEVEPDEVEPEVESDEVEPEPEDSDPEEAEPAHPELEEAELEDVDADHEPPEDDHHAEPAPEPEPKSPAADDPFDAVHDDGEPPEVDDTPSHRGRRVALGLVAVVGVLYVAGYFLTGTRMPANATIGGVDVSGKSPAAARAAVDEALSPHVDREIVLTHGKSEFRVKPRDAGLALDVERSVADAGGERSWHPADMVALFFGEHATDPALDVDDAKLDSVIGTIAESVNRDVVEAQITFPKARPTPREPKAGLVVARADAAAAIRKAYLVSDRPVKVPTAIAEPAVDSKDLARAMQTIARPAVSAPVTIRVGDKTVSLPVTAYAPALVVRVEDNQLKPYLDPKKLAGPLTDSTTGIGKKAVDATVRIKDGKPVVVPGKKGVGLQPDEMAVKLIPALTETGAARSVEVEAKVVDPERTTEDAKALKITEKISSFETRFPYAPYRNTNQGRAAQLMNGTILEPGETFSFNDTVGERTVANGFVTGTVINGGVFREELGGGVSQVVTTTYNAAFFGGMDDVEHHPHAFYIDRYPVGREATVYYGHLDLRFKNPTKFGVLIRSYVVNSTPSSSGTMHVELWSTKVWDIKAGQSARRNHRAPGKQYDDTDRCVPQGPIPGFDIDIYRYFYRDGKKVKTETDTARYQAADHVICGKRPK